MQTRQKVDKWKANKKRQVYLLSLNCIVKRSNYERCLFSLTDIKVAVYLEVMYEKKLYLINVFILMLCET